MPDPARRPSAASRRTGYVIATAINAVLLYLINVRPGWEEVPFLTEDTTRVLGLLNLSLIAGIVANVIFLVYDAPWWRSASDLVTATISLVVLIRVWQVFPFDFGDTSFDWELLVRVLVILGIVGTAIGVLVQVVSLARHLGGRASRPGHGSETARPGPDEEGRSL